MAKPIRKFEILVVSLLRLVVLAAMPEAEALGLKEQSTPKGAQFQGASASLALSAWRFSSRRFGSESPTPK
jgi:hypothetical protein